MLSATEGNTKPESLHSSFPMLCYQTSPWFPAPAEIGLCDVTPAWQHHLREVHHHFYKRRQPLPEHQATLTLSGKHWVQENQGQKREMPVEQRAGLNSH